MLVLTVKGDKYKAARAAADRGIPFAFRSEVPKCGWTVGTVGNEYWDKVSSWFHDCPKPLPQPAPPGTLLLYRHEK